MWLVFVRSYRIRSRRIWYCFMQTKRSHQTANVLERMELTRSSVVDCSMVVIYARTMST